jgi:hypothetical protein
VFGGPNLTPRHSTHIQVTQGAVLASLVASGPVRHRYGSHPPKLANERFFTLCNLAVRRSDMPLFDPTLVCAEENAVLAQMHRQGLVMRYDPDLVVFHERRSGYRGFAQQMRKYGKGRGQVIPSGAPAEALPHLVPVALAGYLVAAPFLGVLLGWPWLLPLALYLAVVAAGAVKVGLTLRRAGAVPLAAVLIVTLHLCYGSGVAWGLVRGRRGRGRQPPADAADGVSGIATTAAPAARQAK